MRKKISFIAGIGLLLTCFSFGGYAMQLTSSAFTNGGMIPDQYSCHGNDTSPDLQWHDIPANTQSFVLILSDHDSPSGTWDHWIVYNIPSTITSFAENSSKGETLSNSWGNKKYQGPCPPSGTHRYIFELYALNAKISLPKHANKSTLLSEMKPHIIDSTQLMGLFQKK